MLPSRDRHRRSIRLRGYDYCAPGPYFVTVCTAGREELFGEVGPDGVEINAVGQLVADTWVRLAGHFPSLRLDEFVIMPNHIHGILVLADLTDDMRGTVGAKHSPRDGSGPPNVTPANASPLPHGTAGGSLCAVVQNFKSVTSRKMNAVRGTPGAPVWQRNYFERVLRDEREIVTARQYIAANPARWYEDRENPHVRTP